MGIRDTQNHIQKEIAIALQNKGNKLTTPHMVNLIYTIT